MPDGGMITMVIAQAVHVVGVVAGFAAGGLSIVAAFMFQNIVFAIWGAVFIAGTLIALLAGGSAEPGGSLDPSVKSKFKQLPDSAILAIGALIVVGLILSFVLGR
jgi:hypothetical protein